jgi:hypothetical protein
LKIHEYSIGRYLFSFNFWGRVVPDMVSAP